MKNILDVQGLNKTYTIGKTNHQDVLVNVDMQVGDGEFVSVMGPSGSGKSTLLYNISGMDVPTSGTVIFQGEKMGELSEAELAERRLGDMGFVFQNMYLLSNLNVFDNIVLPGYTLKKETRQTINDRAKQLMHHTGISELENNDITQASGGQLQRVGICRALINQPSIVFGDEPTGALNSNFAEEVMDVLGGLNRNGTTILLVTHDPSVASRTERVLYMSDGKIGGEFNLGTFVPEEENVHDREKKLTAWLEKRGF